MACGRLGPTSGGVVLHEGRAEQCAGRRAALEAIRRVEEVAGERWPVVGQSTIRRVSARYMHEREAKNYEAQGSKNDH